MCSAYISFCRKLSHYTCPQQKTLTDYKNCKWELYYNVITNHYSPITSILNTLIGLDWLDIQTMIKLEVVIFIYKVTHGLSPDCLSNKLIVAQETYNHNTRYKNNLYLLGRNKRCTMSNIFYDGIRLYNPLPLEVKNASSIKMFKRRARHFLVKQNWELEN